MSLNIILHFITTTTTAFRLVQTKQVFHGYFCAEMLFCTCTVLFASGLDHRSSTTKWLNSPLCVDTPSGSSQMFSYHTQTLFQSTLISATSKEVWKKNLPALKCCCHLSWRWGQHRTVDWLFSIVIFHRSNYVKVCLFRALSFKINQLLSQLHQSCCILLASLSAYKVCIYFPICM